MQSFKFLIAPTAGWLIAQAIKFLIKINKHSKKSLSSHLWRSGGMPSAHTTVMMSLSMVIGLDQGFNSAIFAIVVVLAFIVAYDSMGVRRAVGNHSDAIHSIMEKIKIDHKVTHNAKGHNILEVLIGSILGIFIGTATHYIF